MKWDHAIQDYVHYLQLERGLSANSIRGYRRDVRKLAGYLEEFAPDTTPKSIRQKDIESFIHHAGTGLKARSQARLISGLKSFFSYLVFEGYRRDSPMDLIESPKLGRKLPDTLSLEEIDRLVAEIDRSTPEGERNLAILETLYGCGLRVSELLGLRLSDLYFDEGFVKVTGKGSKDRFVPVGPYTRECILRYIREVRPHQRPQAGYEDVVFLNRRGRQLSRAMIFTIVRDLAARAGLQKSVSPHTFRHSFATHLLQNGADIRAIQQMLGHESITTTEVYMHVDRTHLAEVVRKHHPRKSG